MIIAYHNKQHTELKKGYRAYYVYEGLMTFKLINKCTNIKTCVTFLRPVVTYGFETLAQILFYFFKYKY
jgi:hypothetical protein